MLTLHDIRNNPNTLGMSPTDEDVDLFAMAVEGAMDTEGLAEADAINYVWGDGDWYERAMILCGLDDA